MRHVAFLKSLSVAKKKDVDVINNFALWNRNSHRYSKHLIYAICCSWQKKFGPLPFLSFCFPRPCQPTLSTKFDILWSHTTNWTLRIRSNSFTMMHHQHHAIDFFRHDLVCNRFAILKVQAHRNTKKTHNKWLSGLWAWIQITIVGVIHSNKTPNG